MVETLAELPFIDDQVGLFRARPVGQVRAVRVSLVQSQLVALALLRARVVLSVSAHPRPMSGEFDLPKEERFFGFSLSSNIVNRLGVTGLRNSHARDKKANRSDLGTRTGARTNMRSILNEAFEWLDRAEKAREVAGQLTDPSARKAVLELADSFDRLARAAATPAVLRRRELARKD
jgi:hypothetical protein